jgi:hypothetical protein
LLGRLAGVIGIAPQRLQELWSSGSAGNAPISAGARPNVNEAPPPVARSQVRTRTSGGRGSLVRQAVVRLVRFPAIAGEVTAEEREALAACEEPGIELLRELLDDLRERPVQIAAQVIERWADKPGGDVLQKLLQREEIVTDAGGAAGELRGALVKLAATVAERRLEALEDKSRRTRLEPQELKEFQELMLRKARG